MRVTSRRSKLSVRGMLKKATKPIPNALKI